ncbi:MAG: hypothetical protein ABI702_25540 [Burkholderiales bacterium]
MARGDLAKTLRVQRAPVLPTPQRQQVRVLQTSRAPAQLSLFLRPANAR